MAHKFCLPEEAKIVGAMAPAADAAGRTSRYVSCKTAHKMYIVCYINQGNAATISLTPQQAKDVSGTSAKNITTSRIWVCTDTATSDAFVRQTDAANYTTDAGLKEKTVVFEIDPAALDEANGFKDVAIVTGASNAANITSALFIATPLRYPANVPPSITVD